MSIRNGRISVSVGADSVMPLSFLPLQLKRVIPFHTSMLPPPKVWCEPPREPFLDSWCIVATEAPIRGGASRGRSLCQLLETKGVDTAEERCLDTPPVRV